MRVIGVDLAWSEGRPGEAANETGLVAVDPTGVVLDVGWARGLSTTVEWIEAHATEDTLLMVDAPLVVDNATGQRLCERQVGQRYGRWKVSANSTNLRSVRLAGQTLRTTLEQRGWRYGDGVGGPPGAGRWVSEIYPYTTLVGAPELGFDVERPLYKRKPRSLPAAQFRPLRAQHCDDLVRRLARLREAHPPLDVASHPVTHALLTEASPFADAAYTHREDLIDALVCAWTGQLWLAHGLTRCQVLGGDQPGSPVATIIAPARPEQRRPIS